MNVIKLKLSRYLTKTYLTIRYWFDGDPWYKAKETARRVVDGWD